MIIQGIFVVTIVYYEILILIIRLIVVLDIVDDSEAKCNGIEVIFMLFVMFLVNIADFICYYWYCWF